MGSCKNVKINFASILIFTFTNFLFSDLNNSLLHFILSWSTSVENSLAGKNYDFAIVLMLLTVTSKVTPFSFKRLTKDVSLNAYPGVKTPVHDKKKIGIIAIWVGSEKFKKVQTRFFHVKLIHFISFSVKTTYHRIQESCPIL